MGERKVIQQYFAPDFDPSKVPRRKRAKFNRQESRIMLPFSLQCLTCNEFMYQGKKFTAMKEDMDGEDGKYLGIQRYRFTFKCTMCRTPIAFTTDPKNTDFAMEYGASRNYQHYKHAGAEEAKAEEEKAQEEAGDAMKALENRALDSKRELEILDGLEHIQALNRRNEVANARVDTQAILDRMEERAKRAAPAEAKDVALGEEDEALVKSVVFRRKDAVEELAEVSRRASSAMPPPPVPARAADKVRVMKVKKAGGATEARKKKTKRKEKERGEGSASQATASDRADAASKPAAGMSSLLGYSDSSGDESA